MRLWAILLLALAGCPDPGPLADCAPTCSHSGPDTRVLTDDGTEVLSCVQYATEWGVRRMTDAPMLAVDTATGESYVANSDCVPATACCEPTFSALEMDAAHLIPVPHQIISAGPRRITESCLMLDDGHPIVFGTVIASPFFAYAGGVVGVQDQHDPEGGGHCMVLVGYRTTADGKRVFIGINSWGTGWGTDGDFECSEEFVAQMQEMFAIVAAKEES